MFEAWGRGLYRARRLTLVIAVVFALAAGAWGTGVFSKLTSGNTFTPPNSQSTGRPTSRPACSAATTRTWWCSTTAPRSR